MSAPAIQMWRGMDSGVWVTSDVEYLRLVIESPETEGEVTEFTSDAEAAPWTEPPEFVVAPSTNDLRSFLESRLKSIPDVTRVKVARRKTRRGELALHVWTSLRRDDRPTRFKVYDVEQELVDHFPELIFEFHSHLARDDAPDGDTVVYEPTD